MQEKIPCKLVTKDYDYLAPLAYGDVVADGLDLDYERDPANVLDRTFTDASLDAGEIPFGRHLNAIAQGHAGYVGIPVFLGRAFRHRCFFVRRDSGLESFEQLEGKRIGCNEWPATGHIWSRAILPLHGVRIEGIRWFVGTIDGTPVNRPQGNLPPHAQSVTDKTLLAMLLDGELDILMCAHPPKLFYSKDSPLVRLLRDYRSAEMEYFRRTGIYPPIHIVGVRREFYEKHPWALRSLFDAMDQSRRKWQERRKQMADSTPWLLAEIEDTVALFGSDYWAPYGVEQNLKAVQALCDAQFAQGLSPKRLDAGTVFTEFEAAMAVR
jgi:4,5-dihydroxyphthalate decarboxylase